MVNVMGKQRTATAILEARGAFKKDPQRKRPNEPIVNEPFDATPPEALNEIELACWHETIGLVPAGVLTAADRMSVELVAVLMTEFRAKKGKTPGAVLNRLAMELGKLGLNPSGRAGLVVEKPKENQFK